jgi:AhpC/TSA family
MRGWTRRQNIVALGVLIIMIGFVSRTVVAQAPAEAPKLKVGDTAPDFTLQYFDGHDDKDVKLSDYRGKKNVVLAFYIFAFTGG